LDKEVKFELTPMIDVTFLILIFFLSTLRFKTLEGKLSSYLPTDAGLTDDVTPVPEQKARLILRVHPSDADRPAAERRILVMLPGNRLPLGTLVPTTAEGRTSMRADPPTTWQGVRDYADHVRKVDKNAKAILEAHPNVPHEAAVQGINVLRECGFTDVSFAGIPRHLIRDLQQRKIR